MARPLRIEFPGAVYHVTSRGNERKAIFRDDQRKKGNVVDWVELLLNSSRGVGLAGSRLNIQQVNFLRKKLPALQKNDWNLSVLIERLKKRMGPSQE
jgi:hypothetical protein